MKSITILGRKFKVVLGPLKNDKGVDLGGSVDFDNMVIHIDPNMSEQARIKALLHECAHAGCDISGIDQKLSEEIIEVICQTMANVFYDVFYQMSKK